LLSVEFDKRTPASQIAAGSGGKHADERYERLTLDMARPLSAAVKNAALASLRSATAC
jgi:hypothetical protein